MIDSLFLLVDRKYVDSRSPLLRLDERRPPAAGVVAAAGALHLDHPGAEVAEHHRRVRPGEGPGEVDDEDAVQWSGHDSGLSSDQKNDGTTTNVSQASSGPTTTTIVAYARICL